MGAKYGWLTTIATLTGSKPAFCYPRLSHDALRLRRGKSPARRHKQALGGSGSAPCLKKSPDFGTGAQ